MNYIIVLAFYIYLLSSDFGHHFVLQGIYQSGGRKFVTITVPPLGRLPYTRGYNNGSATPQLMELAKLHNQALPRALKQLQKELKDFKYVTFDLYNVLGDIISHPSKYGVFVH